MAGSRRLASREAATAAAAARRLCLVGAFGVLPGQASFRSAGKSLRITGEDLLADPVLFRGEACLGRMNRALGFEIEDTQPASEIVSIGTATADAENLVIGRNMGGKNFPGSALNIEQQLAVRNAVHAQQPVLVSDGAHLEAHGARRDLSLFRPGAALSGQHEFVHFLDMRRTKRADQDTLARGADRRGQHGGVVADHLMNTRGFAVAPHGVLSQGTRGPGRRGHGAAAAAWACGGRGGGDYIRTTFSMPLPRHRQQVVGVDYIRTAGGAEGVYGS